MIVFSLVSQNIFASSDHYQYFDSDGVKIAYRVFGVGTPLIVLNGGPGRSSDSFTYLAERLNEHTQRQIILFDQRGTGRSKLAELNDQTVRLDLMVQDLENLRKHLGINKISLLGHSFGGMYAMAYAAQFPAHVEHLILSCSGGIDLSWQSYVHHNMLSRLTKEAREKYVFWTSPEQSKKDPIKSKLEALRLLVPAYIYRQEFVPQLEKDLLNLSYYTPEINGLVWKSMHDYDLKDSLKVFPGPALVIAGRQDILGEAIPLSIHQTIAQSKLEFLDECVHYPWLDRPDAYFALIRDFLLK